MNTQLIGYLIILALSNLLAYAFGKLMGIGEILSVFAEIRRDADEQIKDLLKKEKKDE